MFPLLAQYLNEQWPVTSLPSKSKNFLCRVYGVMLPIPTHLYSMLLDQLQRQCKLAVVLSLLFCSVAVFLLATVVTDLEGPEVENNFCLGL